MNSNPEQEADAIAYWKAYNTFPATSETWATMNAITAKYGGKPPANPARKPAVVRIPLPPTHKTWLHDMVDGDVIKAELVYTFEVPEAEAHRLVCESSAVSDAISDHKEINADELKEAKADENLEDYWKENTPELAEIIFEELKPTKKAK